ALSRREAHYFRAKPRDIKSGRSRRHQFNCATGETHRHRPKRIFSHPIERRIKARKNHVTLYLGIVGCGMSFQHQRTVRSCSVLARENQPRIDTDETQITEVNTLNSLSMNLCKSVFISGESGYRFRQNMS